MTRRAPALAAALLVCAAACSDPEGTASPPGFITAQPAQVVALAGAQVTPLLTAGDSLPGGYVMAPKPDGLGAYADGGAVVLWMSHELGTGIADTMGIPRFAGSRVSRLLLDPASGAVRSGSSPLRGDEGYRNLCSATWAGAEVGLPGGWFLTGEEAKGDPHDGIQLAISSAGEVRELPWTGRFRHENLVAIPGFAGRVVLAGTDDDPGRSELYLYLAASESQVVQGGGTLYVLASPDAANAGQLSVGQTIAARFVAIPGAASLGSAQLQAAADAAGALRFVRTEDADYDHRQGAGPALYFADTGSEGIPAGGADWDAYGSLYRLAFDPADPTRGTLRLLARSAGAASGWSSPDNLAANGRSLMMQEDPANSSWARAPRVWRFPLAADGSLGTPAAVAELANPDCRYAQGNCWESSGIIDASAWFGAGAWLLDTQAHSLAAPRLGLPRENGQLLLLRVPGS